MCVNACVHVCGVCMSESVRVHECKCMCVWCVGVCVGCV